MIKIIFAVLDMTGLGLPDYFVNYYFQLITYNADFLEIYVSRWIKGKKIYPVLSKVLKRIVR